MNLRYELLIGLARLFLCEGDLPPDCAAALKAVAPNPSSPDVHPPTKRLLLLPRPGNHSEHPDPRTRRAAARSRARLLRVSMRGGTLCVRGPPRPGRRALGISSVVQAENQRRRTFILRERRMRRRPAAVVSAKRRGGPGRSSRMKMMMMNDLSLSFFSVNLCKYF
nr:PCNA-associated factor isoform X2 [Danio rerio]|eukprot:XP_017209682.1 PCNA-associated factor isoform X2 [Danio rerio]